MNRRSQLLALIPALLALSLSACTASSSPSASGGGQGTVLRLAFSYDPGSLDPDVFYGAEGANITLATYEGLLRYKGDSSTDIEPLLATSWTASADGLTYTFTLRDGVTFTDGTAVDSSTWKTSIERRQKLNQGSAYMVAGISSIDTPDPSTLVVTLSKPDNAFLSYLASAYGPKAVNPKVFSEHNVNDDLGSAWLANNSAGTGPYQLSNATPGQSYELKAFDGYWGEQPGYPTVQFSLVPSFTTQQLMLQQGELDLVYHGIAAGELDTYDNDQYQIQKFDSIVRLNLWVNPNVAPFDDPAVREALAKALDRSTIVTQVYGDTGRVATEIFTRGALPEGQAIFDPGYDPSALKALASSLAGSQIDLAYTTDDALNAQVAQLVQTQLQAAGLNVTTRGVTQETTFSWPTQPDGRPNMLILPANPDSAHPSAWSTLFYAKNGGLSYFSPDNTAEADQLIQDGLTFLDEAEANTAFAKSGDLYRESGNFIPLVDLEQVVVARSGICNWEHDFVTLWTMRLQSLKPCK